MTTKTPIIFLVTPKQAATVPDKCHRVRQFSSALALGREKLPTSYVAKARKKEELNCVSQNLVRHLLYPLAHRYSKKRKWKDVFNRVLLERRWSCETLSL